MDKPNIFRSNNFHMDVGDVLHILVKDLTGTGVTIGLNDDGGTQEDSENVGFTTTLAPTTTVAPASYVLAGTSSNGLLLKSIDDGLTFTNEGNIGGVGAINRFCQLDNGDILCITNNDTVENITQGTSVIIPTTGLVSLACYGDTVIVSDSTLINSLYYISQDGGDTFNLVGSVGGGIVDIIITSVDGMGNTEELIFTNSGIYKNLVLVQEGWFVSVYDCGGGIIYATDNNIHLWKSIDNGATWNDLGVVGVINIISGIVVSGTRVVCVDYEGNINYTDDDLATPYSTSVDVVGSTQNVIIYVDTNILLIGSSDGKIFRSTDNGTTWDEIAGNPQQGEDNINSLIKIN
jgi:hypothetical protein